MDGSGTWSASLRIIREWYVVLIKTDKIEQLANSVRCHCDIPRNTKTTLTYATCIRNHDGQVKTHCAGLLVKKKLWKCTDETYHVFGIITQLLYSKNRFNHLCTLAFDEILIIDWIN